MREEVKKARKAFDKKRPKPASKCARCGMSQEEHNQRGRSQLQIHHVVPISKIGMAANRADNYDTLCFWCHREWHVFFEVLEISYQEFFNRASYLQNLEKEFNHGEQRPEI